MANGDDYPHHDARVPLSHDEASNIALAAAKAASRQTLNETFLLIGVNLDSFESVEKFRADLSFVRGLREIEGLQQDLAFVGSIRSGARKAGSRFMMTVITLIASAFAIGAWEWFKAIVQKHP